MQACCSLPQEYAPDIVGTSLDDSNGSCEYAAGLLFQGVQCRCRRQRDPERPVQHQRTKQSVDTRLRRLFSKAGRLLSGAPRLARQLSALMPRRAATRAREGDEWTLYDPLVNSTASPGLRTEQRGAALAHPRPPAAPQRPHRGADGRPGGRDRGDRPGGDPRGGYLRGSARLCGGGDLTSLGAIAEQGRWRSPNSSMRSFTAPSAPSPLPGLR